MFPVREFEARFQEILDALDALGADLAGEDAGTLEDLNAELEDALFMLSEIDPKGADAADELWDTFETLEALAGDIRKVGAAAPLAERLAMLASLARENVGNG